MWVVEWIDEFDSVKCQKFSSRKEADEFADDLFDFYPVRLTTLQKLRGRYTECKEDVAENTFNEWFEEEDKEE